MLVRNWAWSSTVREFAHKSAASAASPDYVNFQAVIKSAASAASSRGGRASGRLDHVFFFAIFGRASRQKIVKISDSGVRKAAMDTNCTTDDRAILPTL